MLIFPVTLILAVLDTTLGAEYQALTPNLVRRGLEDAHDRRDYTSRQLGYSDPNARKVRGEKSHKSDKGSSESSANGRRYDGSSAYDESLKKLLPYANLRHSESQRNDQQSPQFDRLFTMAASYKVAEDKIKPSKQIEPQSFNQNSEGAYGTFPSFNVQLPAYQFNQPPSKSSDSQPYTPYFQTNAYNDANEKKSSSIPQLQNTQDLSTYLTSFQPLLLNPTDYRFSFVGKVPKVNNVHQNSPFLSQFSGFNSQVVPISTAVNNPQFPQYKGASIQVYPTVGGFSTAAYQPLQAQPQLHFQHNGARVQPVGVLRQSTPSQEIRSDVEIIDKHPTTPPPDKDDEDDDEGHAPHDKEYKPNSDNDEDYEDNPDRYFKAPRAEGDFKPSMTFPFKQYDEKFGKYSDQKHEEEIDDEDEERSPSSKYQSKDTSKPYYSRQEEEEEDDEGERSYERQETEESSDDAHRSKNFDKDFEDGFESSYRRKLPKERYVRQKESSRKGESSDASIEENRMNFRYRRVPQGFKDNERYSSDDLGSVVSKIVHEEAFGYKIPKDIRNF